MSSSFPGKDHLGRTVSGPMNSQAARLMLEDAGH
jgi:hypothetical protein